MFILSLAKDPLSPFIYMVSNYLSKIEKIETKVFIIIGIIIAAI